MIDDGKGASEGRLASSIPLRGSASATVCSGTHKHEGWTAIPPLPLPLRSREGAHFRRRHAHGHTHRSSRARARARDENCSYVVRGAARKKTEVAPRSISLGKYRVRERRSRRINRRRRRAGPLICAFIRERARVFRAESGAGRRRGAGRTREEEGRKTRWRGMRLSIDGDERRTSLCLPLFSTFHRRVRAHAVVTRLRRCSLSPGTCTLHAVRHAHGRAHSHARARARCYGILEKRARRSLI